jgi:hypothetical protein
MAGTPSPLLGILSGITQGVGAERQNKQAKQDRAMAVQGEQAKVAGEQADTQFKQFQGQALQQKMGTDWLEQQKQALANDPKLVSDPAAVSQLTTEAKKRGVSIPMRAGPNGEQVVDTDALLHKKSWTSDATFDERMKLMALPPEIRHQMAVSEFPDAPADDPFFKSPAYVPLSAGAITKLQNLPAQLESSLGKGEITPAEYKAQVNANYGQMKLAGMNPDALLDPAVLKNTSGKLADSKIQQLKALGVHYKDEDKARAAQAAQHEREFGITTGLKRQELSLKAQVESQHIGLESQNLGLRSAELGLNERKFDMAAQAKDLATSRFSQQVFNDSYKRMQTSYDKAQTEYDGLLKNINSVTGNNASFAPDKNTTDRMATLQKQMNELKPKLDAASNMVVQAPARNAAAITGARTRVTTPPPAQSQSSSAPTQQHNGKTYYLYSDGKYYSQKPS